MGDCDAAFDPWLGFLSSLGFAAEAHLNPPADVPSIRRRVATPQVESRFRFA